MAHALRLPSLAMRRQVRRDEEYNLRQWSEVRSLQHPAWLKEIYDRLSAIDQLEHNWDSCGAHPPSLDAGVAARVLLSNLSIEEMPKPHVAPIPDGGIGLHWRIAERDLEIEVDRSGEVHALQTVVGQEPSSLEISTLRAAQNALDWVLGKI